MKNGKFPGPGSIPLDILGIIFNKCLLDEEEPPREWKLAYLTSIHKKGLKKDCKNYRGINVSATIGRLYRRTMLMIFGETLSQIYGFSLMIV
jgi:hypothetical protein